MYSTRVVDRRKRFMKYLFQKIMIIVSHVPNTFCQVCMQVGQLSSYLSIMLVEQTRTSI